MEIDREQVLHIARLARLRLTDDEVTRFGEDLSTILSYVDKLEQVDTTDVEPTTHAVPLESRLREDEATGGIGRDAMLANALAVEDGHFRVPKVVEG